MAPVPKSKRKFRPIHLREWRKYRNLTQQQAAESLEIDYTTLSRIERGLIPYDQRLLEAAAELYGCDPADIVMRNPLDTQAPWSLWEQADTGKREQILGMMRIIVGGKTGTDG